MRLHTLFDQMDVTAAWTRTFCRALRIGTLAGVCIGVPAGAQFHQSGDLKVIEYPGGGQVAYGPLANVNAYPQAIGFMLRTIHSSFGDRPQVGKIFQAKQGSSVAAFFAVTAKSTGKPVTGLVMVSMPQGGTPAAAVVWDDSKRFSTTMNPMMKKLNEVWHPAGASGGGAVRASSAAAPLRQTPFLDNGGSIGLPAGWRITGGHGGWVDAEGSNGSEIHYGVTYFVLDPNNPQTRQSIMMQTQGGRMPLPGSYVAYPAGGDPVKSLMAITAQAAAKQRRQAPSYTTSNVTNLGAAPMGNCWRVTGQVDRHDGKGAMAAITVTCMSQPMNGTWTMTLYQDVARPELAAQERATLDAMNKTYRLNGQVIAAETRQGVDEIHRIGDAARRQAEESHASFDKRNADLAANEDRRDRANQDFSNYQLDNSVLRDAQTGEHATTYNSYADALVQSDPNRYQYVTKQDYLRGIDY